MKLKSDDPLGAAHCSASLADKRSVGLKRAQAYWIGQRVRFRRINQDGTLAAEVVSGIVEGVGDNGAQCDYDARRKWGFNGTLFVLLDNGQRVDRHYTGVNRQNA